GLDITNPKARSFIKEIYDEMDDLFHTSISFHMGADEFIDFGKRSGSKDVMMDVSVGYVYPAFSPKTKYSKLSI
ncbi:hypothetical protein PT041_08895, partial [Erysipelothrix rhusiopathiae]|nr:hypothetical protein [Erysipelothrix rhusiopathiae]